MLIAVYVYLLLQFHILKVGSAIALQNLNSIFFLVSVFKVLKVSHIVPYLLSLSYKSLSNVYIMLLVFRGLWNDGTSASMYRTIMLRDKSIFQISTLICLSSMSICNLHIDLPSYIAKEAWGSSHDSSSYA
jgi:hypothetical protein